MGPDIGLGRRQLYILPTRFGLGFALLVLALLLAGVNYRNGLAYALAFLLASVAVVTMFYTHRNLAGLRVAPGAAAPVFAGQTATFCIWLHNEGGRPRLDIDVESRGRPRRALQTLD